MNAPEKKIYVILAFHAHRPISDISDRLVKAAGDRELSAGITGAGEAARGGNDEDNLYRRLIRFARTAKVPVSLSATNELLFQIRKSMPETYGALKEAYKNKEIFPLYTFAHHTHMVLIHPDEIIDEIKLNREFLHYLLGVPHPRFRGVFPAGASLDGDKLVGITQSKISFVVSPQLDPSITAYRLEGGGDIKSSPFWIKSELLALPIHYSASQGILKILMQGSPDAARSHGFLMGNLPVFTEEYSGGEKVPFPIQKDEMVYGYTEVLRKAIAGTPDKGLILYMQELDPMGLGGQALDVLQESWKAVGGGGGVELKFVTPDEYLAEMNPKEMSLPGATFNQTAWVPDMRSVLRVDGHYPPRGVEEYKGVRVQDELYRRRPLIFWQPGCFMVEAVEIIYETLGIPFDIDTTASKLADEDYDLNRFEIPLQLAVHLRFIKAADNWGLMPDEERQKRAYIHLLCICRKIPEKYEEVLPLSVSPLPGSLEGMIKSLDIIIQSRVDGLREGAASTGQKDHEKIESYLKGAEERMREAKAALEKTVSKGEGKLTVGELVESVGSHARQAVLALDNLQKAWRECSDADAMREFCIKRCCETFPPEFPKLLDELNRGYEGVR